MNLYEHTIIARQDTSPSQLKQLQEKYSKIVEKNKGDVVKSTSTLIPLFLIPTSGFFILLFAKNQLREIALVTSILTFLESLRL